MPTLISTLQRIPFIRISGFFVLGNLVNHYLMKNDLWIGIALSFLITILLLLWKNKHFQAIKIQNILISLALFLAGIFYPQKISENKRITSSKSDYYIAELCNKPTKKTNSYQTVLLLKSKISPGKEKVIAYFSKESYDTTLEAGDELIIFTVLHRIKPKVNSFDFDYKAMMEKKGVYYSVYLSSNQYHKTGQQSNKIIYFAERVRDRLTFLLYKTNLGEDERAVVSALTLGYRSELDRETMNSFVDTGTIHVLSVSGLHVALVFFILTIFFAPLKKSKFAVFLYPGLIILCLWGYAFITGFSPSIQRSTVMFSFVILGSLLRRPVNIFNSLMASALLLILIDANVLFDIGFQLSYLALFGIILLQPSLENLLNIKNKSLKWIWTLFTVSIAAQLVTFPLSIFYFNQFPNLFWLSNFIAIPGTTLIIWLTFLFFIFSPITLISNMLASIIQFFTHLMLISLQWMSQLPHAVSEGIVYNPFQTLIMYGFIFALIIYGFTKNKKWLFSGLFLLILFQTSSFIAKYEMFNQKIVFQHATRSNIIHCVNGRNNYILRADHQPFDYQQMQLIKNTCYHLKLHRPQIILLNDHNDLINNDLIIKGNTLYFLNCRITINNHLFVKIRGRDAHQFQNNNPKLLNRPDIHYLPYQQHAIHEKASFSMDLKIDFKEAVCIYIN